MRRKILFITLLGFCVSLIFSSILLGGKSENLERLNNELDNLILRKDELTKKVVLNSSLVELEEKVHALGFSKTTNIVYINPVGPFAKVP